MVKDDDNTYASSFLKSQRIGKMNGGPRIGDGITTLGRPTCCNVVCLMPHEYVTGMCIKLGIPGAN